MKLFDRLAKFFRHSFSVLSRVKKGFNKNRKITINSLSDDLLLLILNNLNINERLGVQLVCKKWKKVIEKSFEDQKVIVISDELHFPIKQCCIQSNIRGSDVNNLLIVPEDELTALKIIQKFSNLKTICWVTKSLSIKLQTILNTILLNRNHINMKSINLFDSSTSHDGSNNRTKELDLRIHESSLQSFMKSCSNLKQFKICALYNKIQIDEIKIESMFATFTNLELLEMRCLSIFSSQST